MGGGHNTTKQDQKNEKRDATEHGGEKDLNTINVELLYPHHKLCVSVVGLYYWEEQASVMHVELSSTCDLQTIISSVCWVNGVDAKRMVPYASHAVRVRENHFEMGRMYG